MKEVVLVIAITLVLCATLLYVHRAPVAREAEQTGLEETTQLLPFTCRTEINAGYRQFTLTLPYSQCLTVLGSVGYYLPLPDKELKGWPR